MYEIDYTSPLGILRLRATDEGLVGLYWPRHKPAPKRVEAEHRSTTLLERTSKQLDAYFAGRRQAFDLPLAPSGTPFQLAVWRALSQIPFGETRSYSDVAKAVGRAPAVRAVAAANARNPLSIIVPCHRVIGKDGTLTGYAGGVETKRWLLTHER